MTAPPPSRTVRWPAAIWAGLIGGLAFLILEMVMVPLFLGGSPWMPVRGIAAILLGKGVLPPPPPTFGWDVFLAALAVHAVLSVVFAAVLVWVTHRWDTGMAALAGAVGGLVLYGVNFYLFTGIFPWFAMSRGWVTIFSHLVFGVVVALTYKGLIRSRPLS
ncbi:Sodium:proline symporter [Deinococcus saxicola]|uniref:hypothetical protein n=1 Tax=Deinococcus saxicola TaxID=249406 RepID=UPI0039EECAF9